MMGPAPLIVLKARLILPCEYAAQHPLLSRLSIGGIFLSAGGGAITVASPARLYRKTNDG
jgi:hypothetical protein